MKLNQLFGLLFAGALIALPAVAQHDHDHKHDHGGHSHDHDHGGGMDEAAMMEMWMKAATPGEPHAEMAAMAGEWTSKMTMFEPGKDPVTTEGTASFKTVLDGRVLVGEHTGMMSGFPHNGMSWEGFDNVTGEYWTTWIDNMGTGITTMRGTKQADGSIELKGSGSTPMGPMPMRMVSRADGDEAHMEFYMTMAGMGEMKGFEISYKRVKS